MRRCRGRSLYLLLALGAAAAVVCCAAVASAGADEAWARSYAYLPRASGRARHYLDLRYILFVAGWVWLLVGLVIAVLARIGPRVSQWVGGTETRWPLRAAVVWVAQITLVWLWMLPLALASLYVERRYGFYVAPFVVWLRDRAVSWVLEWLYVPVVILALLLVRRSARRWWLWLATALVPLGFLTTVVYPEVIDPLYNRFEPLRDAALTREIQEMAGRAGLQHVDVFVMDASQRTTRSNAYVTGLGPTKRVVLYDTLLAGRDREQVLAVVAHELGHYALRHIWWGFLLHSVGGFVILALLSRVLEYSVARRGQSLGVKSAAEPAVIPLAYLCLSVLLAIQSPVVAAVSQTMERQADAFGVKLYPNSDATARSLAMFATRDYADPDPPTWYVCLFSSHPPLRERVAFALRHGEPTPVRRSMQQAH